MTHIQLTDITKIYPNGEHPVVHDITLDIESGQFAALLGPSGSGKTTILKMLAGLIRPTVGDILFDGASVLHIPPEKRSAVMVFQNYLLFPHMTVQENIGFGLRMRGVDKKTRRKQVFDMLELVQLPGLEGRYPKELSGGQQQRVALARALVTQPHALLLDEPLSNLDAHLRDEMRDLITRVQRETGITTILVTHDQQEAAILASRIALLEEGWLQQVGSPEDFYRRPNSRQIAQFFGGVNFIPVDVDGDTAQTSLGDFVMAQQPDLADPRYLTIRPEQVGLLVAEDTPNSFEAYLDSCTYMGMHMRYCFRVNGVHFDAVDSHRLPGDIQEGDTVRVSFPPEALWLLDA